MEKVKVSWSVGKDSTASVLLHYEERTRDGCALCFNGKKEEREKWLIEYPEALKVLKWLQAKIKSERPDEFPLRNHKFFINEDGTIN